MSRIGKLPIAIPEKVEVNLDGTKVTVNGSDMVIDYTGMNPQVNSPLNSGHSGGLAAARIAFKCLTLPSAHHSEAEFQRVHDDNPLKCGSTPEDLVAALRFFVNTPSVSGQIVCVDGGQHFDPRLRRDVFEAL